MAQWIGTDNKGTAYTWDCEDGAAQTGGQAQIFRSRDGKWAVKAALSPEGADYIRQERALFAMLAEREGLGGVLVEVAGGGDAPHPFLVMPWYAGGSLAAWVAPGGQPRPLVERARAAVACCALVQRLLDENQQRVAHREEGGAFVHRDVKPGNFLVRPATGGAVGRFETAEGGAQAWELRLCDLGGSVDARQSARSSRSAILTAEYAPLEQIFRLRGFNAPQIDVYCCGTTIFHLLTLRLPGAPGKNMRDGLSAAGRELLELLNEHEAQPLTGADRARLDALQRRSMDRVAELFEAEQCVALTDRDRQGWERELPAGTARDDLLRELRGVMEPAVLKRKTSVDGLRMALQAFVRELEREAEPELSRMAAPVVRVPESVVIRPVRPAAVKGAGSPEPVKEPELTVPKHTLPVAGVKPPVAAVKPILPKSSAPAPKVVSPKPAAPPAPPAGAGPQEGTKNNVGKVLILISMLSFVGIVVVVGIVSYYKYEEYRIKENEKNRLIELDKIKENARMEQWKECSSGKIKNIDKVSTIIGVTKWIPPGCFIMGSGDGYYNERHQVVLTKGFWMMEHEVTQYQWKKIMGNNPSTFPECGGTCPVEMVSWDEVQLFIKNLNKLEKSNYRLPTESEWEYAARGGEDYKYSGSDILENVAWYKENSESHPHAVCQKQKNSYGLCDMSGNVFEWVQDAYDKYPEDVVDYLSFNSKSNEKVYRGGCWMCDLQFSRVTYRGGHSGYVPSKNAPPVKQSNIGFRLVLSE